MGKNKSARRGVGMLMDFRVMTRFQCYNKNQESFCILATETATHKLQVYHVSWANCYSSKN